MKAEILSEWNTWWEKKADFNFVARDLEKEVMGWAGRKEIIGIVGVRRGGKTSLLKLVISHLAGRIGGRNILFIKCDDERVEKKNLVSDALELYKELINPAGRIFIFIDEIQEVPEWESTLKRLYDLESDAKIFLTGSNFSVLKEDLAYKLAGRIAYFELYPFSFREFLRCKMGDIGNIPLLSRKQEVIHHLLHYMEFGGFPEVAIETDVEKKRQLLRFYYDTIVYRDIIKRREIRGAAKMENMINYFLQNISNPSNFSKVGGSTQLSTDSVGEYVRYLQDAFFIFSVPLFSFSAKKQEINPKKIYCIDTGLRNIKGFRFSDDYGRLAENIVFAEIKRRNCANPLAGIFYWVEKKEVDFLVKDGLKVRELIQVCWDIEKSGVREREEGGLLEAMEKFKLKKGLIITERAEEEKTVRGKKIIYMPLWKWLLG